MDGFKETFKKYYNKDLKKEIDERVNNIKGYSTGLDDNIKLIKEKAGEISRKEINFSFFDRFSRRIYANPFHVAKIEFVQYIIFIALLYFYNPMNINTNYPAFTKLLILVIAFVYVILFIFIKMKVEAGEDVDLIQPTESNILIKLFSIFAFFVLFMLLIKIIIWLFHDYLHFCPKFRHIPSF